MPYVEASPSLVAGRLLFVLLSAGGTALGIYGAAQLLDNVIAIGNPDSVLLLLLFGLLFGWISANFWLTVYGFVALVRDRLSGGRAHAAPVSVRADCRTAVVMPVFNENPAQVERGLRAMRDALHRLRAGRRFDIFILSDSNDPEVCGAEERMWRRLARESKAVGASAIYYRRRADNTERKSGNIQDFLEQWGHGYRYMIVLDADSILDGATMQEMVRRMEANPRLGLLQTRPQIIGAGTPFSRMQQFASWAYGRLIGYGMAALFGPHGNYWGHNAIIRVDAFMESCGLPRLPGREPLGGEILSHDFVEAAFLVRNGWEVRMAPDLTGSFEASPPNLPQNLVRDRRWCQGNLQHMWVVLALGIHPVSRINLITGMMAYLSGPIWLLFITTTVGLSVLREGAFAPGLEVVRRAGSVWSVAPDQTQMWTAIALLGGTIVFLVGPKVLGLLVAVAEHPRRSLNIFGSFVLEIVLSFVIAPCVMMRHSAFVIRLLAGRGVRWTPQQREADRVRWREAWRMQRMQTLLGVGCLSAAAVWPGPLALWVAPVFGALALSVPAIVLTGSARAGHVLRRAGIFGTPEEAAPPRVLRDVLSPSPPSSPLSSSLWRTIADQWRADGDHDVDIEARSPSSVGDAGGEQAARR